MKLGEAKCETFELKIPSKGENLVLVRDHVSRIVKVTDAGVFKRAVPGPEEAANYRGHGILLMLALMDQVTVDESANGTTVHLVKKYRQCEPPE